MAEFGQVIEAYAFRGQNWITIWDFGKERKFSLPLTSTSAFIAGMLVTYDRSQTGEMQIASIDIDELPQGALPVMEPKVFAGQLLDLPPFLSR